MSKTCKYCNEPENKQDKPGLVCEICVCFVHLSCLRRRGTPGEFACDVFFDFTCEDCSPDKNEVFKRSRFPWVNVILLTLHHLSTQSYGISNYGFFHYKTHICSFIDRHWQLLFGNQFKQKKNWVGTIAGALSVYNNSFFCSGSATLGETGWWKLMYSFSPATAAHIIQEMAKDKPKGRPRNQMAMDKTLFMAKVTQMGYKYLIETEEAVVVQPVTKKRRVDSDDLSGVSNSSYYDQFDSDSRNEGAEESAFEALTTKEGAFSDVESIFRGFDFTPAGYMPPSDSSSLQSYPRPYDTDSRSGSPPRATDTDLRTEPPPDRRREDTIINKRETLFSSELNSVDLPWMEKTKPPTEDRKPLVEMTQYEEVQLLKQVEALVARVRDPERRAELARLRARLALRRIKRHKQLPIFDLDKQVKLLGGYVTEEDSKVVVNGERILDRFQRSYLIDNLSGTIASTTYGSRVVSAAAAATFRSPYSGGVLRPHVRRDVAPAALWLRITDQLLRRTHRHEPGYEPPPRATLDYSYVRPHHIAAVNSLCAQFFWPGIDLTESLEYPEFSCVVTYRRVVVACAFLVPDAAPHEAYVSFVLTRPEWRNAGIATFMLYHLLQTCTGRDVTLHVSPTNPAIFLYQKFGFKVEELVQDFYEKYYDIDYKGCRHALFLRLVR